MNIAIDLDFTISANNQSIEFFSILTRLLIAEHRIYIISNREPGTEQDIAEELHHFEVDYNDIVIASDKADYIRQNNINILFEDTDEYFLELDESVLVFKIREAGNFSFAENKWYASHKTVKMIDEK